MMITPTDREYLLARSYVDKMLDQEEVQSLPEGDHYLEGVTFKTSAPTVAWTCRSMSGQVIGFQTRRLDEHEYRWHQAPKAHHLPIIYATEEDHDLLYKSGRLVLTEGCFDRAALKRVLPEYAVYARLSKGIAKHLLYMIERYANTVWLCFDQDKPGEEASEDAEKKLAGKMDVNRIRIPAKDPSKLIETRGEKRAREIIRPQIEMLEI